MAYASRDDVYLLGLSAQAFLVRARPYDDVEAATGTIRLKGHGLSPLDIMTFEVSSGGKLPTGISAFTPYSPLPITSDLLRVAATPNGAPLTWQSNGSAWGITIDPGRRLDAHLEETAAEIDECLTAHKPPIQRDPATGKFPQILVGLNARMAARADVTSLQFENPQYRTAFDRIVAREAADGQLLAAWKAGKPIQPRPTDETDQADNAAMASSGRAVDWRNGGCL